MNKEEIQNLLYRYANGTCNVKEKRLLEDMIQRHPLIENWQWTSEEEKILMGIRIKQQIDLKRFPKKAKSIFRLWPMGIAASLLLLVSLILLLQNKRESAETLQISSKVLLSDTTGIVLTLSNGSSIQLDGREEGIVSLDRGVAIKKLKNGQLVYDDGYSPSSDNQVSKDAMNTIHIPKGKDFQLTLPDGTKVWLNTASTFSYPVTFYGSERRVMLTGEAYFEVTHDSQKPFKVIAEDNEIQVTGTHFNVSAYSNDAAVTTTLMEGGVNILKNGSLFKLTPGYQAISYRHQDKINSRKVNTENVMAWRAGYFVFNDQNIASIMKDVARWYDIEVVFNGDPSNEKFGGTFPKSANINDLLEDLESLGHIRFRKQGKEVTVMR